MPPPPPPETITTVVLLLGSEGSFLRGLTPLKARDRPNSGPLSRGGGVGVWVPGPKSWVWIEGRRPEDLFWEQGTFGGVLRPIFGW